MRLNQINCWRKMKLFEGEKLPFLLKKKNRAAWLKKKRKVTRWNETSGVYTVEGSLTRASRDKGGQKTGRGFGTEGKEVDHFATRIERSAQLTWQNSSSSSSDSNRYSRDSYPSSNPSARSSWAIRSFVRWKERERSLTGSLSLFNILVISASRRAAHRCLCTRARF